VNIVIVKLPFFQANIPNTTYSLLSFQRVRELCNWFNNIDIFGQAEEKTFCDPTDADVTWSVM
jgi:hypothetical protein